MKPSVIGVALTGGLLTVVVIVYALISTQPAKKVPGQAPSFGSESAQPSAAVMVHSAASGNIDMPVRATKAPVSDLYLQAVELAGARDRQSLSYGLMLTQICRTSVEVHSEPGLNAQSSRSPESLVARAKLQQLCKGFAANDKTANAGLEATYFSKLRSLQTHYVAGVNTQPASAEQIKSVIAEGDWYTFDFLFADIMPHLLAVRSIDPNSEAAVNFGVAYLQAACYLGKDCSPDGVTYLAICAQQTLCRGSMQENAAHGLSAKQRVAMEEFRAEIVAAFRRRDQKYFIGSSSR